MCQAGQPAETGTQVTMNLFICNVILPKASGYVYDTGFGEEFNVFLALAMSVWTHRVVPWVCFPFQPTRLGLEIDRYGRAARMKRVVLRMS
jgi:hypothetical protein